MKYVRYSVEKFRFTIKTLDHGGKRSSLKKYDSGKAPVLRPSGLYSPRHDPDPEMIPTFLLVDLEMILKELGNGD